MRTLKKLYPQYGDHVTILAIDTDPTESPERIRRFREDNDYPWPMAATDLETVVTYRVLVQSTKVAVDRDGIIRFREGYGAKNESWWEQVLSELAQP